MLFSMFCDNFCSKVNSNWYNVGLSLTYFYLLPGKQEANSNIGQLRSMESDTASRSGQFIFLVSAMVFASVTTLITTLILHVVVIPSVKVLKVYQQ